MIILTLESLVDSEGIDFHELSDDFDFANETAWRFPLVGNMPNTESNGNEADRSRYAMIRMLITASTTPNGRMVELHADFTMGDANIWLRGSTGPALMAVQLRFNWTG